MEVGDRDDDLIHAGVPEEDGEFRLPLVLSSPRCRRLAPPHASGLAGSRGRLYL